MGSDNSKIDRNDTREHLNYGSPRRLNVETQRNTQNVQYQNQVPVNLAQRNPQHLPHKSAPPPSYSSLNSLQTGTQQNVYKPETAKVQIPKIHPQTTIVTNHQKTTCVNNQKGETGNNAQKNNIVCQERISSVPTVNANVQHMQNFPIVMPRPTIPPKFSPMTPYNTSKSPIKYSPDYEIIKFDEELIKLKDDFKDDTANLLNKELIKNKSLAEIRKILVNNRYLSDARIILDSKIFYGHKLFLITASPLFYQHFQVQGHSEMKMDGISEENLLAMLTFCYTGNLQKLTDDNVLSTYFISDKLKISQAFMSCCSYINNKINANDVFTVFETAIQFNSEEFQTKCLNYIKNNEDKCFSSSGFFKIGLTSLIKILEKCDYPTEKLNEISEKWNHGPTVKPKPVVTTNNNPTNPSNSGMKKGQQQRKPKQPQPKSAKQENKNQRKCNKNADTQNIQNLMDLAIPPPPFAEGFHSKSSSIGQSIESVASSKKNLIIFGVDDDDDGKYKSYDNLDSLVCVDDEDNGKVKIVVKGIENMGLTEFARIDFIAKRSFDLHEIWFNENLINNPGDVRIAVSVFNGEKQSDIHVRVIKLKAGCKLNFIKFSQKPLKIYLGQKFFIKLNFTGQAERKHLDPQCLLSSDILELRKDDEVRKYFNCINKLVVSEMI